MRALPGVWIVDAQHSRALVGSPWWLSLACMHCLFSFFGLSVDALSTHHATRRPPPWRLTLALVTFNSVVTVGSSLGLRTLPMVCDNAHRLSLGSQCVGASYELTLDVIWSLARGLIDPRCYLELGPWVN
jgi:hypothetical protein